MQISEIGISNLEHKWITGTDSFADYFPSNGKVKEAAQKRYQYTTVRGGGFVDELESKENYSAVNTLKDICRSSNTH